MIKGFIKASDRLPVGTVTAKDPVSKLIGELNVYDDRVTFSAYPSYHIEYKFSDNGLYRLEWLDESPADGEAVVAMKDAVELIEYMHQLTDVPKHLVEDYGNKYCNTIALLDKSIKSLTAPEGV